MNLLLLSLRRPAASLLLGVVLASGGALGLSKMQVADIPPLDVHDTQSYLDYLGAKAEQVKDYVAGQYRAHFQKHEEAHHEEERKVVITSPKLMDITLTQPFVCQIHSQRHINVCAMENGYLQEILVREGQAVKKGDLLFRILPVLYKARLDAELAEARLAELEYNNTENLYKASGRAVVSQNEVLLFKAKLDKAKAKADLARAEFNFTNVVAPFDGIVDRLHEQLGSLIKEGDVLTTLSDNKLMWVYFNVPEAKYLEYMARSEQDKQDQTIELVLANHKKFPQIGKIGAIEAKFNNETGNIPFRADFPNPGGLLRHGQTGTVLISRTQKDSLVIPQRATFDILDKRYVWVVGEDDVAHQTLITIKHELEDVFVIASGLNVKDRIVLEGVRQVEDGEKVEYEMRKPEEALKNQKFHAE